MPLIDRVLKSVAYRFLLSKFDFWERYGVHVVPDHYYFPIPNLVQLRKTKPRWERPSEMAGLDMNLDGQLRLMRTVFPRYAAECDFALYATTNPYEYFINNGMFPPSDASILHCMIRHFQPTRIVEIGSGFSTLVSAKAKSLCDPMPELTAIEPYPSQILLNGVHGLDHLIQRRVEDMGIEFFSQLEEGDILFIDSSHVCRLDADVLFLCLEVMPRLAPGVIIHFHDICLPLSYPEEWIFDRHWFWNEQYLLQAFMAFNTTFQVLWATAYMNLSYLSELQKIFVHYWSGSSFWIRRKT